MDEIQRIKDVYKKRRDKGISPYTRLFSCQRERELKEAIKREGYIPLKNRKILDVGCGNGSILSYFLKLGASPDNLYGIDLLPERIEKAKKLYPSIQFICGSADRLLYPDKIFDIVTQFTVFTSILDAEMRRKIASEMIRVLKPNGIIIWHDYRFNNPFNHDVKGIGKREIKSLFPRCEYDFKLIHLNPIIGRPLAKISTTLCNLLEKISILQTHWIVRITKQPG